MFRIFWTDIGDNVSGQKTCWNPNDVRIFIETLPHYLRVYRVENTTPTRGEIVKRQLMGAA